MQKIQINQIILSASVPLSVLCWFGFQCPFDFSDGLARLSVHSGAFNECYQC